MAEYYSRQLRTNVKRGHLYNAQNCLYNGHKTLGYGVEPAPEFGKDRQRYVIDPVTAPFVQKIFEDYAAEKPMVDIAKELNSLGVTTVRGKPLTVNSLAHILNNRAYIGEYRYGDIVTPDGMPAIVSPEVFEAAQKRLVLNKRQGGQRANGLTPNEAPRFWLTGKLYCGKCGTPMQGCSGTSSYKDTKHYYYACGTARKKRCSLKYVKKDKNEISIQHFFDEYKNADLNDLAVRDYLLDYFVDKIFVYDDKVVLTAWYGDRWPGFWPGGGSWY